jgi:methylmalonic aciduria homocystinuria type C protein
MLVSMKSVSAVCPPPTPRPSDHKHPVDTFISQTLKETSAKAFNGVDIIFDYDKATPTSVEPRINIQTAGHVAGSAFYYQRKDVDEEKDKWDNDSVVCGVSIHPVYGGWFAFRAVIVLKNIHPKVSIPTHCSSLPIFLHLFLFSPLFPLLTLSSTQIVTPSFATDSLNGDPDLIVKVLTEFNDNWKEMKWRDIIPVKPEHRYSSDQIKYYHTELQNRDQSVLCAPRST